MGPLVARTVPTLLSPPLLWMARAGGGWTESPMTWWGHR